MLPAHIAENIRRQILYYLQSTFAFRDRKVERQFDNFLNDPQDGMFKGPWVTLRRPYRPAAESFKPSFDFTVGFHPFRHQARSWVRLTSKDRKPESTIVTTGTGSGKTECFLYPILDHCLRTRKNGEKGIKAIVLYPMNALASDQEKRFAKAIWNTPELKAAGITVGTYTGRYDPSDPGAADTGTKGMGPDNGISHHATLQENPPDVLLTNYKMLDFLLMRPQDQRIWRYNRPESSPGQSKITNPKSPILQYLVLDELHTYDGAQGSDVACLIRRLKERLGAARGELCCVGTSATLEGSDPLAENRPAASEKPGLPGDAGPNVPADVREAASDRLAKFASKLFEEDIPVDAVIGEDRLEVEEIVKTADGDLPLPAPADCVPEHSEDAEMYAMRQAGVWSAPTCAVPAGADAAMRNRLVVEWEIALGEWLKTTKLFRYLLEIFRDAEAKREYPLTWLEVVRRLAHQDLAFNAVPTFEDRHALVVSFFALVAHAQELRSGKPYPLVPTQVQLWIRELRRLGRVVADAPAFAWIDEPPANVRCLPTFHCSECGESGWVGLHDPKEDAPIETKGVEGIQLMDDASRIYQAWFGHKGRRSQHIVIVAPWGDDPIPEGEQGTLDPERDYLCPASLVLRKGDGPCPRTDDTRRFRVRVSGLRREDKEKDEKTGQVYGVQGCPRCGSKVGVFFVGSQSATLASVAIDEMFGSILNSDPKLLAFTDSVQDASHRAGFFTARTYHFTFRTALQHVIDEAGEAGVPLMEIGPRVLKHWSQEGAERPGSIKEAMATLMPPDLQEYQPWVDFRDDDSATQPSPDLLKDIETRLTWEAVSEFGLMQTHGRTMEPAGSAGLGWRPDRVTAFVEHLRERLPRVSPALEKVSDDSLRLWVLGMLHRYREEHLKKVLEATLEEWRVFLHPYQRKLVQWNTKGPMNITGAAGTGKTVALVHRAVYLAERLEQASDRVLLTTFTTNLSITLKEFIRKLNPNVCNRVEVTNLHALARTICSRSGWRGRIASEEDLQDVWEEVWMDPSLGELPLSRDELIAEHDMIVDPNGIDSEDAYLTTVRSGRPRISRRQRRLAWPVFLAFQRGVKRRNLLTFEGAVHQARLAVEQGRIPAPARRYS